MRIGFLGRCLGHSGGIGRYARSLLDALARVSTDELVLLCNRPPAAPPANVRVVCRERSGVASILAWEQLEVPRIARAEGLDLLYSPDFVVPAAWRGPAVVTVHDVSYALLRRSAGLRAMLYYGAFARGSARRAGRVLTVSEFSKRAICRLFGLAPGKVAVARPAADAIFRVREQGEVRRSCEELRLAGGYVLYVGLLGGWKNLARLLRAFAGARGIGDILLVLAGKSCADTPGILREAARLGLGQRLRVLQDVPDAALPLLYNGARAFVFPSLYEGFGLPPIEAMACGVPVICSNAGALPETTAGAAWLVDPRDTEALSRAIETVLGDDALRKRMIDAGLRRAAQLSWEACARTVLRVFHEVRA